MIPDEWIDTLGLGKGVDPKEIDVFGGENRLSNEETEVSPREIDICDTETHISCRETVI